MKKSNISRRPNFRRQLLISLGALCVALLIISTVYFQPQTRAAGNLSGRVFQDFNANGNYDTAGGTVAVDAGLAGVVVTAYDSIGAERGSATTAADGAFTLAATGTGPYRLEFTSVPSGFQPSARSTNSAVGGSTTDAGTLTQFVADGATANINIALNRPEEYCQNNPTLVTSRFAEGAQNGTFGGNSVLVDFPYNSGTTYTDTVVANYDNPTAHELDIPADQIGTTFGLTYSRLNNRLYAAAYFKKHAGFGPGANGVFETAPNTTSDDPGAIYVINPANNTVTNTFTVAGANANRHDSNDYGGDNGDTGWNAVGKTGLGGIALADDESRLFVMNLQNKTLYALNPTTGAELGNQAVPTANVPTPGGTAATCPANDVRPFAVKYYRGSVYVGMVCSAQTSSDPSDLHAYVYQVNPTTLAFGAAPLFRASLNYTRGFANPGASAAWQPWKTTYQTPFAYAQPMFADMEFDDGNLIMGLRDRAGDQAFDAGPDAKRTGGDTLRACGAFGAWTLESNGRCGGAGTAPQSTNQGPGGGEFYHQDDFCLTPNGANYHDEVSWGGLVQLPGHEHIVTTLLDPISRTVADETFDGGIRYLNNTTGNADRAYRLYNGTGGTNVPVFGKTNGMGELVAMCKAAPIEIGNRVWKDLNGNGVQDPQESRAAATPVLASGVTVRLYNASNVNIATAVTDQDGEYYFVGGTVADADITNNIGIVFGAILPNTNYQVRFDNPANYAVGGALNGLVLTLRNSAFQDGDDDSSDSDAANVVNPTGSPAGTFPVISLTTGANGANNHTFDVGFAPAATLYSLGNRVWFDANNNGRFDAPNELGANNVAVSVFADANGNGAPDSTTPLQTTATDTNGYYRFDGLSAGSVVACVTNTNFAAGGLLSGKQNTSGSDGAALDTNVLASENGVNLTDAAAPRTGGVCSQTVVLGAGANEPTGEADLGLGGQGTADNQADMTVDYGFYGLNLSGTVWNDSTNDNGILESGEPRVGGKVVKLFAANGTTEIRVGADGIYGTADDLAGGNVVTTVSGDYAFNGLPAGSYIVKVVYAVDSSTPTFDPNTNVDNNDDGTTGTGANAGSIVSGLVTLTPGSLGAAGNNTITYTNGTTSNPTVDFGIKLSTTAASVTLGGRVMNGKRGIAGTRLTLTDADGVSRVAVTNSFGYYRFADVSAGQTVTVSVFSKRYQFDAPTQVISVTENLENLDFSAGGDLKQPAIRHKGR